MSIKTIIEARKIKKTATPVDSYLVEHLTQFLKDIAQDDIERNSAELKKLAEQLIFHLEDKTDILGYKLKKQVDDETGIAISKLKDIVTESKLDKDKLIFECEQIINTLATKADARVDQILAEIDKKKGDKGDPFTFNDLTESQKKELTGKDGSPDTPLEIAGKLNTLEGVLDISVFRGFKDEIKKILTIAKGKKGGGVTLFQRLRDVPQSYTGQAGKVVQVKATEDGLEFGDSSAYVRNQYSSRFSEQISVSTVTEALDAIFAFTYVAPGVTLSAVPGTSVREFGNPITSQALTATTTKTSNDITSVGFYRGASVINTVGTPDADGGVETYTDTDSVGVTSSWTVQVGDGTSVTTSNAITVTFVYPIYVGVGAPGLTPAQIQGLTKLVKVKSDTAVVSSPSNEVYYFAAPASYGDLTSILDTNQFETIGDYTKRTENFTMLDATSQSYYIYEFQNLTTQSGFTNTYKY